MRKLIFLAMMWFIANLSVAQISVFHSPSMYVSYGFTVDSIKVIGVNQIPDGNLKFITRCNQSVNIINNGSWSGNTWFNGDPNGPNEYVGWLGFIIVEQPVLDTMLMLSSFFRDTVYYDPTVFTGRYTINRNSLCDSTQTWAQIETWDQCGYSFQLSSLTTGNSIQDTSLISTHSVFLDTTATDVVQYILDNGWNQWTISVDLCCDTLPTITMSATPSIYVTGGWIIDTVITSQKGCWSEYSYSFLEDECGNRSYLAGAGGGVNSIFYEYGWLGYWKFGQVFQKGLQMITVYSNPINFLPVQGTHSVSGYYQIDRDPLCINDYTSLTFTLNHNCSNYMYTVYDPGTANYWMPSGSSQEDAWWSFDSSMVDGASYIYEIESINSSEVYQITFDLGNCIGVTTQELEKNKENLFVYPNPTTGLVKIGGLASNSTITITDALGQLMLNGTGLEVNLSEYPTGFYFLKVSSPQGIKTFKVVKQ